LDPLLRGFLEKRKVKGVRRHKFQLKTLETEGKLRDEGGKASGFVAILKGERTEAESHSRSEGGERKRLEGLVCGDFKKD